MNARNSSLLYERDLALTGRPIDSPVKEIGTKRDEYDIMPVVKNGLRRVYPSYSSLA